MSYKARVALLVLVLLAMVGAVVACAAYLMAYWPQYYFPALIILFAVLFAIDYRNKRHIFRVLECEGYREIKEGIPNTYKGIYRPHWEIGHIEIPLAKRNLFGFPTFESWSPRFSECTTGLPDPLDETRSLIITFVGIPSKRGHYGHRGIMNRKVAIESILELKPLAKSV